MTNTRWDDAGARALGAALIGLAVIVNPLVLSLLSPDGRISSVPVNVAVVMFEVISALVGIWFWRRRPAGSANLALLFAAVVVALCAVEAFSLSTNAFVPLEMRRRQRAFYQLYEPDSLLGFRVRPNLVAFEMRWLDDDLHIRYDTDARGLRNAGRDYDAARIWFVGDSFTFGEGVERTRTFYGLLEEQLGEPVISLGSPGYDVIQYERMLERHLPGHEPQVIVLNVYANDLKRQPSPEFLRSYYRSQHWDQYETFRLVDRLATARLLRTASERAIHLVRGTETGEAERIRAANGVWLYRRFGPDPGYLRDSLFVATEHHLVRIAERTRQAQTRLVVFLLPSRESTHHEEFTRWLGPQALAVEETGFGRICELMTRHQVPCHDLTPVFRAAGAREALYFPTDPHWNERGHAVAERAMRPHLAALLTH